MPLVKSSYDAVLERFGERVIRDRFQTLYEMMESYLKSIGGTEQVIIQEDLLSYAVMDYFADAARLKDFEGIERINLNKIVSYEAYWILRRRPLCPVAEQAVDDELLFCNEGFAAWLLTQAMLQESFGERLQDELPADFFDFYDHLYYHIKYRQFDPKSLELMMAAYEAGACTALRGWKPTHDEQENA